jgi:hypothetical protein
MVENYLGLTIRGVGVLRPTRAESQSRLFLLACALESSKGISECLSQVDLPILIL